MAQPSSARPSRASAWRTGAWPLLALLGLVLPLAFLPQIEDYLYYLRVAELLPAYGTAWLFLAVIAVPVWLLLVLLLKAIERHRSLDATRSVLTVALIASAAAAAAGALL